MLCRLFKDAHPKFTLASCLSSAHKAAASFGEPHRLPKEAIPSYQIVPADRAKSPRWFNLFARSCSELRKKSGTLSVPSVPTVSANETASNDEMPARQFYSPSEGTALANTVYTVFLPLLLAPIILHRLGRLWPRTDHRSGPLKLIYKSEKVRWRRFWDKKVALEIGWGNDESKPGSSRRIASSDHSRRTWKPWSWSWSRRMSCSRGKLAVGLAWMLWCLVANCLHLYKPLGRLPPGEFYTWAIYFGNRSGILSLANLPLVFLLGMRNNPLCWLTGISLSDINFYHRIVGWGTLFLAFVHTLLLTVFLVHAGHTSPGIYTAQFTRTYFIMGILGAAGFVGVCGFSIGYVRRWAYEVFMVTHVIFSIILLIGSIFHWTWLSVYPCAALLIYCIDRLSRSIGIFRRSGSKLKGLQSTIEILDERCMRLLVDVEDTVRWKAGQWVWIGEHANGLAEWHPFSIANTVELQTVEAAGVSKATQMGLLVGIHKGFTSRLQTQVLASDPATAFSLPIFVDGPYGHSPDTGDYDTIILVAGGTGITYMASVLEGIIWAASVLESDRWIVDGAKRKLGKTRKVVLVWSVRERHHFSWINLIRLKRLCPPTLILQIYLCCSAPPKPTRPPPPTLSSRAPSRAPTRASSPEPSSSTSISSYPVPDAYPQPDAADETSPLLSGASSTQGSYTSSPPKLIRPLPLPLHLALTTELDEHIGSGYDTPGPHPEPPGTLPTLEQSLSRVGLHITPGRPDIHGIIERSVADAKAEVLVSVCGPVAMVDSVVHAANASCDPERVRIGDLGGDVTVEIDLFG